MGPLGLPLNVQYGLLNEFLKDGFIPFHLTYLYVRIHTIRVYLWYIITFYLVWRFQVSDPLNRVQR